MFFVFIEGSLPEAARTWEAVLIKVQGEAV